MTSMQTPGMAQVPGTIQVPGMAASGMAQAPGMAAPGMYGYQPLGPGGLVNLDVDGAPGLVTLDTNYPPQFGAPGACLSPNQGFCQMGVPAPLPAPPSVPAPAPLPSPGPEVYTVQKGDTVYKIAKRYGTTMQAIIQANNLPNPDLIYPGQILYIP